MVVLASGNALQCTVARMGEYLQALNNKEQHVLFDFVDCLVVLVFSRTLHGFDCNTHIRMRQRCGAPFCIMCLTVVVFSFF